MAQRCVNRFLAVSAFQYSDMTQELMFNGAINYAIDFYRSAIPCDPASFQNVLYFRLKAGAIQAMVSPRENRRVEYHASVDRHVPPEPPRTLEPLIAKEMLERIAALEMKPNNISVFLQAVINLGPEYALLPASRSRNRPRTHSIDYEEVCDELGLAYNSATHYFAVARKLLRQVFNPEGTLFVKTVSRANPC